MRCLWAQRGNQWGKWPAQAAEQAAVGTADSAQTHRDLALALHRGGRRREAEFHWRKALHIAP